MRQFLAAIVLCVATLVAAPSAQACWSSYANLGWTANEDFNFKLNDFALIFMDSHPNNVYCGATAAAALKTKLQAAPDTAFSQGFLSGGNVALAFATAMQLGPRGLIDFDLDQQLARVGRLYNMQLDADCGFDGLDTHNPPHSRWTHGNTCQEDRLIGAGAYAWIGAYFRKSGRPWEGKKDAAILQIFEALHNSDSVCRHNKNLAFDSSRGPCNGGSSDPVISINHGAQSPAYGIGQITSMSVALIGLDAMERPWNSAWLSTVPGTADVLAGMWTEGKNRANSSGVFENECYDVNNWQEPGTGACSDMHFGNGSVYQAYMFPVWWAFERYSLPGRTSGGYQFQLSDGVYSLDDRTQFLGAARYVYYHILTKAYNDYYELDPYGWPRPATFNAGSDYWMGMTANGYWVATENNGGGAINANRSAQGPWESVHLLDLNGGWLLWNDDVRIKTTSGYYWSATGNGGSTLLANQTSPVASTQFRLEKRNAVPSNNWIMEDGNQFVLRAANGTNYVVAGSGGTLSATGNSTTATVFTFKHVVDY